MRPHSNCVLCLLLIIITPYREFQSLEQAGLSERDRDAIMEMVMDISGAKNVVKMGVQFLGKINSAGLGSEINEVSEG